MSETWRANLVVQENDVKKNFLSILYTYLIQKQIFLYITALLLGRAVILFQISPFALAFLAACMMYVQKRTGFIALFLVVGSWTYSVEHALFITISIMFFLFSTRFLANKANVKMQILFLFFSILTARTFLHTFHSQMTIFDWTHYVVEGLLAIILLIIFMQCMPLFTTKYYIYTLKNEEIISLIILIASVLTGFIGWELYGTSLSHIFSRFIVIVLAFIGGPAIGATVGVVTGLILSLGHIAYLYELSLLAFAGLLGGLFAEGKKIGVGIGLLIATMLVSTYSEVGTMSLQLTESFIAILFFYMMPKDVLHRLSKYIPGTSEYTYEEKKHVQKMRDVTARQVEQYSNVFETLSKSFLESTKFQDEKSKPNDTDYLLSFVTEKTCQQCFMKKRCWEKQFDDTYSLMEQMKEDLLYEENVQQPIWKRFENYCVKSNTVLETMKSEVSLLTMNAQLKKQVVESKKIVADQLQGISTIMDNFAKEMVKERHRHEEKELEIIRAIKQMDIALEKVDIYQIDKGNIDIEMALVFGQYHGEGEKIIAPVLSHILQETVVVEEAEMSPFPNGVSYLTFRSAKQYTIETGVATAAKGGGLISGDCYMFTEVGSGKFAVAISDGMGNGLRAREESSETLRLLKQLLQTGISEQVAIESINSILALRTTDEIFATLDLAIVNLQNAVLRFLKIGSVPSFIKRGDEVFQIEASNLPIGIVQQVEIEMITQELKQGDIVIMMSDGIFDGPKHIKNSDIWLTRKIAQLTTEDPQEMADILLEEVVREQQGEIRDDMTVVVTKIDKFRPEWASIPVVEHPKIS